jgi:hypothetical protein
MARHPHGKRSQSVLLRLVRPRDLGFSWEITLPLFLVVFGGIAAGLLIGFVWEWWREHRYRVEMRAEKRERQRLEREVSRMRPASQKGEDVLALLDGGGSSR